MQSFVVANGLSISQGGSYQIVASIDPQTTATTAPILVAARPTVDAPPVLYDGHSMLGGRGRHRHLVGFELDFSAAMDPTAAANPANYSVVQFRRRGRRLIARAVKFRASYDATAHWVVLTLVGRPKFAAGGKLVVAGSAAGGLVDASGTPLAGGGATFIIARKGSAITPSPTPASRR